MGLLENKARARLFYKYLSKVYDRVNPFVWNEAMRTEAIDMLDLGPDDCVLDVGCGTGFGTEGLLQETEHVHGLDQSVHQLEQAWAKLGKHDPVAFTRGDAERLPYQENSFDALWSSGSIEYWPNPVSALEEFRRVVKPGGPVLVVGPDQPNSELLRKLADSIMLFYDATEAEGMFEAAGLVDRSHYAMQSKPGSPRAIVTLAYAPEDG
jgi:demethylmenaquinone methyltransferase/2-methoxy-6-polyprenyl-1,4-benzoquinol methylase